LIHKLELLQHTEKCRWRLLPTYSRYGFGWCGHFKPLSS